MPVHAGSMLGAAILRRRAVFLSASIPDSTRWEGDFDALEITDAVAAAGRAVLTAGGTLVTAAHPTIAPLLLYVASEFPVADEPRMLVYQSTLFDRVLPEATERFEEQGVGTLRWTQAVPGEEPVPGRWDGSLSVMRETMFVDTDPVGAIFIGGMEGIRDEFNRFLRRFDGRPVYPLGRPGGEARAIAAGLDSPLGDELRSGDVYPTLFRRVVADLATHLD